MTIARNDDLVGLEPIGPVAFHVWRALEQYRAIRRRKPKAKPWRGPWNSPLQIAGRYVRRNFDHGCLGSVDEERRVMWAYQCAIELQMRYAIRDLWLTIVTGPPKHRRKLQLWFTVLRDLGLDLTPGKDGDA